MIDTAKRNQKVPIIRDFQAKKLNLLETLITAVDYAKIFLQA